VARLALRVTPRRATPSTRVRFKGLGFTDRRPVYAHYVRRGEVRRTVRLAKRTGTCGGFSVRRRQFPFRPAVGRWTLQVDQQRAYAPRPGTPVLRLRVTVLRG
jgi:hypothetical protein